MHCNQPNRSWLALCLTNDVVFIGGTRMEQGKDLGIFEEDEFVDGSRRVERMIDLLTLARGVVWQSIIAMMIKHEGGRIKIMECDRE